MFKTLLCFACGVRGPHDRLAHPGTGKMLWKCRHCGAWTALPGDLSEAQQSDVLMIDSGAILDPLLIKKQRNRLGLSLFMLAARTLL